MTPAQLRTLYATMSARQIAALMGISKASVESRVRALGLTKDPAVAGRLRAARHYAAGKDYAGWARELRPDPPTECPEAAMRGVCYDAVPVPSGCAIAAAQLGARLPRWAAQRA